jgi:hypothetical protein
MKSISFSRSVPANYLFKCSVPTRACFSFSFDDSILISINIHFLFRRNVHAVFLKTRLFRFIGSKKGEMNEQFV